MTTKTRYDLLKRISKKEEEQKILHKVAADVDVNAVIDADAYADLVFDKILESIKIEGLED